MNTVFNRIINERGGFITEEDKAGLMPAFSQLEVLVRTGCNRYLCALEDVEQVFSMVEKKNDYVRDVGLTSENFKRIKNNELWKGRIGGDIQQCHPDM